MNAFSYARPRALAEALRMLRNGAIALAGGTDLVGLMKDGLARPASLVDLTGIEGLRGWSHGKGRGLRIGALTPLVELETSDALAKTMPILRESLRDAATVQLRTMGTVGGNLLQRNRCWYFRDEGTVCWLKGGSRCFAIDGENRYHAIIGAQECVIVSPSDLVPALLAYSPDKMRKVGLVDTPNLFCDAYCLEPGQEQTAHRHGVGDKLYYVVAGTGQIRVGNEEHAVAPGDLVCAPAGEEHGVRNPGPERLALLVVMAPKP